MKYPPRELLDDRADPDSRSVLADWYMEHGIAESRLGSVLVDSADAAYAYYDDGDDADDDADADDADDADADDAYYDADAAASDAAAADADAADDAADDIRERTRWLTGEIDMREGLKIIKLPGGYYGRSVTRVGWLRRHSGDEWELLPGARSVWRTGGDITTLDRLASHGPMSNYRMSDPQAGSEEIHRLLIRRCIPADEAAWAPHCPRPPGWRSE